jgi:hypothetical protein
MRLHVKVGGRYQMDDGHIVVDSIATITVKDVTYDLARESGFESVDDLLRTAKHGKGEKVYLIRFHYLPPGAWDRPSMILTRSELIETLQQEVRILVHLAGKVEPSMLDYRPTRKQRSTLELLQYLAIMGPTQLTVIEQGVFDRQTLGATWSPPEKEAKAMSFEQAVAAIGRQSDEYARRLGAWTDEDFRKEVDMFGRKSSRGLLVIWLIVNGHAAYRTQLFLYLKACGRDELSTMNLWAGVDMPQKD